MNTSYKNQDPSFNNQAWDFLVEFPLDELLADMDVRDSTEAGLLLQTIKGLGIGPELLAIIERKLISFASEAIVQRNLRRLEAPTNVRLFCNRFTPGDINPVNSSDLQKQRQIIKSYQIIHYSEPEIKGGWGYFMVERGAGSEAGRSGITCNWIELYIYKEGD